jgi:LysR family cys regulon transcriptional activator
VTEFKRLFPKVHLVLLQASPGEIVELLNDGEADIGIATETLAGAPELVTFPFYSWHHAAIVPAGHPLEAVSPLTLEAIAEYPVVTYHEGFTGRSSIDATFARAGLLPDIVMSALDADVIKTYVELALGVGIVASVAYDAFKDRNLALIAAPQLFPRSTTRLAVRRGIYLRSYALAFIEKVCPDIGEERLKAAIQKQNGTD